MGTGKEDFRAFPDVTADEITYHFEMHYGSTHDLSPDIGEEGWRDAAEEADENDFDGFSSVIGSLIPTWWGKWSSAQKLRFFDSMRKARQ